MKSTSRTTRSRRRAHRQGPLHLAQLLFIEAFGFGALITVMLGLGRENWFLSLITAPASYTEEISAINSGDATGSKTPGHTTSPFPSHTSPWISRH